MSCCVIVCVCVGSVCVCRREVFRLSRFLVCPLCGFSSLASSSQSTVLRIPSSHVAAQFPGLSQSCMKTHFHNTYVKYDFLFIIKPALGAKNAGNAKIAKRARQHENSEHSRRLSEQSGVNKNKTKRCSVGLALVPSTIIVLVCLLFVFQKTRSNNCNLHTRTIIVN